MLEGLEAFWRITNVQPRGESESASRFFDLGGSGGGMVEAFFGVELDWLSTIGCCCEALLVTVVEC